MTMVRDLRGPGPSSYPGLLARPGGRAGRCCHNAPMTSFRIHPVPTDRPLPLRRAAALWDVRPGFLDTASYGPPPRPAWDALQASLEDWREGAGPWTPWAETVDSSRRAFAEMVGIDAAQVVTGAAVSQLLAPIGAAIPDGATVLVPDIEFTSAVFPFAVHADRGVTVTTAPVARLAEAITTDVAAVSFSAVQSATGEVADIAAVVAAAREAGAITIMDTTQGTGWLPVSAMDVDILVAGAYKWLCAPRGTAFLTMHPDLDHRHSGFFSRLRPVAAGWYSATDDAYFGMPLRLRDGARAYDISPAWHSWVGTAPALGVLNAVGVRTIHEHNVGLANMLLAGLGLEPSNSAIAAVPATDAARDRLRAAGIRFTHRAGVLRLAFHLYNTEADVAAALAAF